MNTYILDPSGFEDPTAPTAEELEQAKQDISCAVVSSDYTLAPVDDVTVYSVENYTTQMEFSTDYVISHEQMRRNILGLWRDYTPAEELRDRLNDWLQGKQPALAVNTRFWRGL